jgi:hypothetical protein
MVLQIATLITAITIALVAAYFSIAGLVAIFSGAAMSVIIMASALELGKLISAIWLHLEWKRVTIAIKVYLSSAVVVLMLITSIGIFGYLSKAHLEQTSATDSLSIQVAQLDKQLGSEQKRLDSIDTQLGALDAALDKYIELGYVTKGLEEREKQAVQRDELNSLREGFATKIEKLNDEMFVYTLEEAKFEAELGPIKYIAEMLYGDEAESQYGSAVRLMIFMLIFVFDPLAIILLIISAHRFKTKEEAPSIVTSDQIYNLSD